MSFLATTHRRGENPNSLKNLNPAKPGDVRNPTGRNRNRPYTDAYEGVAQAPLPEFVRRQLNKQDFCPAIDRSLLARFPLPIGESSADQKMSPKPICEPLGARPGKGTSD
jgi:hypothetical protein